jgi:hypothetical protein
MHVNLARGGLADMQILRVMHDRRRRRKDIYGLCFMHLSDRRFLAVKESGQDSSEYEISNGGWDVDKRKPMITVS